MTKIQSRRVFTVYFKKIVAYLTISDVLELIKYDKTKTERVKILLPMLARSLVPCVIITSLFKWVS